MDTELFEKLLRMAESESLDFKRDQYLFASASDEVKSELLKDILAFANSWRETEARILIGVEEVPGARGNVHGIHSLPPFLWTQVLESFSFLIVLVFEVHR